MFWEVGQYINSAVLGNKRAAYGKQILSSLSAKLIAKYGKSFAERNIYRMSQFAQRFPDIEILSSLTTKLSWTHLPPKAEFEAKIKTIMIESKERLERRKTFINSDYPLNRHLKRYTTFYGIYENDGTFCRFPIINGVLSHPISQNCVNSLQISFPSLISRVFQHFKSLE